MNTSVAAHHRKPAEGDHTVNELTQLINQASRIAGTSVLVSTNHRGNPQVSVVWMKNDNGWKPQGTFDDRVYVYYADSKVDYVSIDVHGAPDEDPADILRELLNRLERGPLYETAVAL